VIFVKERDLDSTRLRGDDIAHEFGTVCLLNDLDGARAGETVVFVKTARDALVREAKDRGCVIAFDPIDYFCYESDGRPVPEWLPLVDKVIVPNGKCEAGMREMFPAASFHVIPHQWDARLDVMAEHDAFRPGYIGRRFNFPVNANIPQVNAPEQMMLCAPWFNCHVQIREPNGLDWTWKPATKVATAAAVGAPIITTADPSSKELLGPDYPLYIDSAQRLDVALEYCRDKFLTPIWEQAREIMAEVRKATSVQAIARLYRGLE
jgi:hypothetical protein